jgi:hypothetical protein
MAIELSQATQQAVYGPVNDTQILVKARPGQAHALERQAQALLDESLLITLAGAVVGVASGLVIGVAWIAGLGDLIPGISFRFPVGATVTVAVISVVLGSLAAVLPARRVARVDVIKALTYE